jgi:hypothetical protein
VKVGSGITALLDEGIKRASGNLGKVCGAFRWLKVRLAKETLGIV